MEPGEQSPLSRKGNSMAEKSHQKWVAEHTTRVVMNLNHNTDAEILAKLASVPSKQGYIKQLIRADLATQAASK